MLQKTTTFGKPRVKIKRKRPCPVCLQEKVLNDFRVSNRNSRLSVICLQCRRDDPRCEAIFYGTSFRRTDSRFRKIFWAIKRLLEAKLTKKEVKRLSQEIKEQSLKYYKFPERVAAIIGKTFACRGDDYKLSDDEALQRIRDLVDELDDKLIARNKNKRLSKTS